MRQWFHQFDAKRGDAQIERDISAGEWDALAGAEVAVVEASDLWSEQDTGDLTAFSLGYADTIYPEDVNGKV